MGEPSHPGPIEPANGPGRVSLWLGLLLVVLLALGYASGDVPPAVLVAALLLGIGMLVIVRSVHRRRSREREAAASGAPGSGTPAHEAIAGLALTALYLLFVLFADEFFAELASAAAGWLEGLGFPREETAESVETLLRMGLFLIVVAGWLGSWSESRKRRAAERALAYGEDTEAEA